MSFMDTFKDAFSNDKGDTRNLGFGKANAEFTLSDKKDVKITTDVDTLSDVDVKYPLIKPFTYAHVKWNEEEKALIYRVLEPELEGEDRKVLEMVKDNLSEKIDVSLSSMQGREKILDYLKKQINDLLIELGLDLTREQQSKILYYVYRDFVGLGKVEPFMHDPYIEDLGCDGTGTPIFAVHSEFGSVKSNVVFNESEPLENLVVKLAERCGRYVSYAKPLLDGALPDGSRVNASLTEDVTSNGPTFSIRKFQDTPFSAIDMINLGTSSPGIMAFMWLCQQYKQNILVCGGTSTGKTSFMNSIISFIPPEDKIVSIEDTRELQLPHENWIPSVTREMFGQGDQGDVDMDQLLKESFRQNPDYVVVGEVRGEEASVLFQGMSSGHPSMGTMHASSPNAVVKRLITPPISLSSALIEAIDIVIIMTHAKGVEKSARRCKAVHELQKVLGDSASARTNVSHSWTAMDDSFSQRGEPFLFDEISKDFGVSKQKLKDELQQRKEILEWLQEKDVTDFHKVSDLIAEYYKNKEAILKMVNSENKEYSLDEVLGVEEELDLSKERESNYEEIGEKDSEKLDQQINGDTPVEEKKKKESKPASNLHKKLKNQENKLDETRNQSGAKDPFKEENQDIKENPFEA